MRSHAGDHQYAFVISILVAACSGGGNSSTPNGGGGGDAGGGGGVSFGGAQDFGQFRAILAAGGIPGPDTLDANGFFDEHYVPPPSTPCTAKLCLTPGASVGRAWLDQSHQMTLQVSVNTNVDPTTYTRLPLNLVVVIDHSGSMAEQNKLVDVKAGLSTLIDNLQATDHVALVEFDDTVTTLWKLSDPLDRTALHNVVNAMQPGGGTAIFDGLQTGFQLSTAAFASDHQNRVIFLSDGMATAGNTDTSAILTMADSFVSRGIGLTTVGVGTDFDVTLMRGLAEHGAGNFYFLEDASAAPDVFMQELNYFTQPLALDLHVDAVAGVGYDFGNFVGSTLYTQTARAGTMDIPAVFVANRTSVGPNPTGGRRGGSSMLFIALHPNGMNDAAGKIADLTLTYRDPATGSPASQTVTLAYPADPTQTPDPPYLSNPEMAYRYAIYNLYLGFAAATQTSYVNCAVADLQATRAAAVAWNATREDPDITADIALIDQYIANLRAVGAAATDQTLATCMTTPPVGGGDDPGGRHYYGADYNEGYACSASSPSRAWLAVVGAALAIVVLRRRRR